MTDEQIIQKARDAGMTGEATPAVIKFVRNLLEAEIEACAGLCERFANRMMSAEECADAIRARKSL